MTVIVPIFISVITSLLAYVVHHIIVFSSQMITHSPPTTTSVTHVHCIYCYIVKVKQEQNREQKVSDDDGNVLKINNKRNYHDSNVDKKLTMLL